MAVIKTAGSNAALIVTHGGQKQVVTSTGAMAAVHDGEAWHQYRRNGSTVRKPAWNDDHALDHGSRRDQQDEHRAVKSAKQAEADRVGAVFADRRNKQLYPGALRKV